MNSTLFTKEKHKSLKKDYDDLLIERREAVSQLSKAREMGDLSENGYYRAAKSKLSSIDYNIHRLSNFIKYGSIINFVNKGFVEIGCTVTIKTDNKLETYRIVGKEEANPKLGQISNESPLGKLLIGRKVGETIEISTPSGKIDYEIIKIE